MNVPFPRVKKDIALIGLGNVLFRDEGFGVHFVRYLKNHFHWPERVELIDGGCAGLGLLHLIRGRQAVFLFDIYSSPEPPGTIRIFDWDSIEKLPDNALASSHQFGVKEALKIARLVDLAPPYFKALAVVPEIIEPGTEPSETLKKTFGPLFELLQSELALFNVHPSPKSPFKS